MLEFRVQISQFDNDQIVGRAEDRVGVATTLGTAAFQNRLVIAGDQPIVRTVRIDQRPWPELRFEPGTQSRRVLVIQGACGTANRPPLRLPFQVAATGDQGGEDDAGVILVPARQLAPFGGLQGFFGGPGRHSRYACGTDRTGGWHQAGLGAGVGLHGQPRAAGHDQKGDDCGEESKHESAKVRCFQGPASLTDVGRLPRSSHSRHRVPGVPAEVTRRSSMRQR